MFASHFGLRTSGRLAKERGQRTKLFSFYSSGNESALGRILYLSLNT